jgi:hypothetical protein
VQQAGAQLASTHVSASYSRELTLTKFLQSEQVRLRALPSSPTSYGVTSRRGKQDGVARKARNTVIGDESSQSEVRRQFVFPVAEGVAADHPAVFEGIFHITQFALRMLRNTNRILPNVKQPGGSLIEAARLEIYHGNGSPRRKKPSSPKLLRKSSRAGWRAKGGAAKQRTRDPAVARGFRLHSLRRDQLARQAVNRDV